MSKKSKTRVRVDPSKVAELDFKTQAVFLKKGYKVDTMLGAGSFGEVYKGLRVATGEPCAVKMMILEKMSNKFKKRFLPRELASLMELRHEYVIRVWDIFRSNNRIYIFMEFAANGDLARYLKQHGTLSDSRARTWFSQVTIALHYLHEEMSTAHRDVKIDNILMTIDWKAKLTDFGFATEAKDANGEVIMSRTHCGTLPYYSPQILQKQEYNPFKADIWAHGVVLFAMTHNKFPFHFKDIKLMLKEHLDVDYKRQRLKRGIGIELKNLLLAMFETEELKRLTIVQVQQHPWMMIGSASPSD